MFPTKFGTLLEIRQIRMVLLRVVQSIRNQGGGSPQIWQFSKTGGEEGGNFFKIYKFYMTHFGLIKLESSNLLDITIIDGYKVINYNSTRLREMRHCARNATLAE